MYYVGQKSCSRNLREGNAQTPASPLGWCMMLVALLK
jgi:hypothetical protein